MSIDAPRAPSRRGFTLIELLVVVSIIALFIAVLLPSLQRARKQAKAVVCLTNIRSLLTAVEIYAGEYRGRLPTAGLSHGGQGDEGRSWVVELATAYGKQKKVVRCPEDESPYWKTPLPVAQGAFRQTSYASNGYTVYAIGDQDPYDRFERIRNPSATVFWVELVEQGDYAAADHVHPDGWWFGDSRQIAAKQVQIDQHLGKANYGFLDGHDEPYVFEQTYKVDPAGGFPPVFLRNKYDPALAN